MIVEYSYHSLTMLACDLVIYTTVNVNVTGRLKPTCSKQTPPSEVPDAPLSRGRLVMTCGESGEAVEDRDPAGATGRSTECDGWAQLRLKPEDMSYLLMKRDGSIVVAKIGHLDPSECKSSDVLKTLLSLHNVLLLMQSISNRSHTE